MSKNYTIPANTDWITLADLMGEDYDSTQYYVIHVNEITNGLLQYTCRLDMPTNEDIGQQFSDFSTIKVGTDVGDYTFLKATDTPIDVEVFVGSEDEPSPTPTPESTTGGVLPKNIAGLVMCLDGEINSRAGIHDESINGMQNLVYTPFVENTSTKGVLEKLNGTPTFTDKSCKLGGTMFVPCYQQTALTFEFVGNFDTNVFNNIIAQQLFTNSIYKGGYQIFATADELHYQLFDSSNTNKKHFHCAIPLEANKTYHFSITDNFGTVGSTKFYINGEEVSTIINKDETDGTCTTWATNIGIMGVHNTTPQSVYPVTSNGAGCFYGEYTNINAYRLWSRALTAEEIRQNYLQDKKRFG